MKNRLIKWIVLPLAIVLIIFGLCFWLLYGKFEIFMFPFISAVWGTASDWVLAAGSILSVILLVRTLNEQQTLTKIETNRHMYSIRPKFRVEVQGGEGWDDVLFDKEYIKIYIDSNSLKDLNVVYTNDEVTFTPPDPRVLGSGDEIILKYSYIKKGFKGQLKVAGLFFRDIEENKYLLEIYRTQTRVYIREPIHIP